MTELLWALLIIFICVIAVWLLVGALCAIGLVQQCFVPAIQMLI